MTYGRNLTEELQEWLKDWEASKQPVRIVHVRQRDDIMDALVEARGGWVGFTHDDKKLLVAWLMMDAQFGYVVVSFAPGTAEPIRARAETKLLKARLWGEIMSEHELRLLELRIGKALGWETIPVPRFARNTEHLDWLLDQLYGQYELEYAISAENGSHCAEIGYWQKDGRQYASWSAVDTTLAFALCRAIDKCEIVMGEEE